MNTLWSKLSAILIFITFFLTSFSFEAKSQEQPIIEDVHLSVYVYDADTYARLKLARITLRKDNTLIGTHVTDIAGYTTFKDLTAGDYTIKVHYQGYHDFSANVTVADKDVEIPVGLSETSTLSSGQGETSEIVVTATHENTASSFDNKTGNQVFNAEQYNAPPTSRMTDLIQENLLGAAKASTGEVHIRGQHGEFTYYLDGIPVPLGVFGGLNEVIDPKVIDRITFLTGGFPAEYGGQMAGIIDMQSRVPSGGFHMDFSTYAGSYLVFNGTRPFSPGKTVPYGQSSSTPEDVLGGRVGPFRAINSNGQTLSLSDHFGKLGVFISASRQQNDRRIDTPTPVLYNANGTDTFLFGKFDYLLSEKDYLTANINWGRTNTQVPFDTSATGGRLAPDNQVTTNAFQTISYFRTISAEKDREQKLFIGVFAREGSLLYTPGAISPTNFTFLSDPTKTYALTEDRSFVTTGIRSKYDMQLSHSLATYAGFNFSATSGTEKFTSRDSLGNRGPNIRSDYRGSDFGMFAQVEWHIVDWLRLDLGGRYDQHIAPDIPLQSQWSPRLRANFFLDEENTVYLYYGKLFMPTNLEGIRQISSNVADSTSTPTLPERDEFYELGYLRTFQFGLKMKLALFHKVALPGLDDETVGSSSIKVPVNIERVETNGIEVGLSYAHPTIPLTGYINAALVHAFGSGKISGGFLPIESDGRATDLDHDQRLSIVASINYEPKNWFVNLTGIYGSGLTNGNPQGLAESPGLFAFNSFGHVDPSFILNTSAGYRFPFFGKSTLEPSIYITNLLDNAYLLKGAYFSGASFGERRNVVVQIRIHI